MAITSTEIASLGRFGVPVSGGTQTMLQPKQAYRFRVLFYFPTTSGTMATDTVALTRNVQSVDRPRLRHQTVDVHAYNSIGYYAGKHEWQEISLRVRDDVCNEALARLGRFYYAQFDHLNQAGPLGAYTYKFAMTIDYLDGGNPDAVVLERWSLLGCFFSELNFGEMDYSRGGDYITLQCSIRYDNAVLVIGNEVLEGRADQTNCGLVTSNPLIGSGGLPGSLGTIRAGGGGIPNVL